jgi:exodeoxyribonuclease VII small subunit
VSKPKSPDSLSFEDALAQIEAIIERIESGQTGLEQSLAEYERGVGLINHCRSKLDRARQQVEDLTRKLQTADEASSTGEEGDSGSDDPDSPTSTGAESDEE